MLCVLLCWCTNARHSNVNIGPNTKSVRIKLQHAELLLFQYWFCRGRERERKQKQQFIVRLNEFQKLLEKQTKH